MCFNFVLPQKMGKIDFDMVKVNIFFSFDLFLAFKNMKKTIPLWRSCVGLINKQLKLHI